jgi:glycosyltransferase involved in cell wall biosynthesis
MSEPYRVLVTCGAFEPGFRAGGPIRSVAAIVDTAPEDVAITLVTADRDLGDACPYPGLSGEWVERGRCRIFYLNVRSPRQWLRLWRELRHESYDLLYLNSLWSLLFTAVPVLARALRLIRTQAVLLAPRGELGPDAPAPKARAKRLFRAAWGQVLKAQPMRWHASTDVESAHIRTAYPWADIVVVSNQTSLPAQALPARSHDGSARIVFLGRISPQKNLELLLRALDLVPDPVRLDIYGPIEDAPYWSRCQSLINHLPPHLHVGYRGAVEAADVAATFNRYDAFAFPTLGENFGHAIAESLSASCPVICSAHTPWTGVLTDGGGLVTPLAATDLAACLKKLAAMTPDERHAWRAQAGQAYERWTAEQSTVNILAQVR